MVRKAPIRMISASRDWPVVFAVVLTMLTRSGKPMATARLESLVRSR